MLPGWLFHSKKLWVAVGAGVLALVLVSVWSLRTYRRAQVRDLLNAHAPFQSPPLEVSFPRFVLADSGSRDVLEPGLRMGLWSLEPRSGEPAVWEVRLTNRGHRWFSQVGNQIVATFKLGTRKVSRLLNLGGTFPRLRAQFRYAWTSLHPSAEVLGASAPELARNYEGEAWLFYEQDRWKVLYWSTPELEQALARFRSLQSSAEPVR